MTRQPFSCVNDESFREMVQYLNPKAPVMDRARLKDLAKRK
jgi:hypothetical protein